MDWQIVALIISGLLGTGGVAAWWRARGQNKTDEQTALNESQAEFRKDILAQLKELKADRDQLLRDNGEMRYNIAVMANHIENVQKVVIERDQARKERDRAFLRIDQLEKQVEELTRQVEELGNKQKDDANEQT